MTLLRALLALTLALFLTVPVQAGEWLRADTHHFTFFSDGSEQELRDLAELAERFDGLLRKRFGVPAREEVRKLDVYMLRSSGRVAKLLKQNSLAGFYSASAEGSFIVTNRGWSMAGLEVSGQVSLFHEYAHHFMYRNLTPAYPSWYREGFPEYVSTVTFEEDGTWTFGRPAQHRMHKVLTKEMDLDTLLNGDLQAMETHERVTFYAWSWLLTHMLMADPQREAQLGAYLECLSRSNANDCASSAFGDLKALEDALLRYRYSDLAYRRSSQPLAFRPFIDVTRLDALQSELIELGLVRRTKRQRVEARNALADLAKRHPEDPRVLFELALAERDVAAKANGKEANKGFAKAEALVDRAIALDPTISRAHSLKMEVAGTRLVQAGRFGEPEWDALRKHLVIASTLDPNDPLPLYLLYRSHILQRRVPNALAQQAMRRAFERMPESIEVRISYAMALALRERFDEARDLVRVLASDPHSAAIGRKALAQLDRLETVSEQRKAAWRAEQAAKARAGS